MTAEVRRWKTMKARMHHRNSSNTTLDSDTTWASTVCSTVTKGRQATSATEATITTEYSFPKLSRSPSMPTATTAKTNARSMRASMTRRDPDSVVSMEETATVDAYTEDTMQENTKTTARSFQNDFGSYRREWSRTRVGVGRSQHNEEGGSHDELGVGHVQDDLARRQRAVELPATQGDRPEPHAE